MASKKTWIPISPRQTKPRVPDSIKSTLKEKADALIESVLKPVYIQAPPTDNDLNYLVDIYSKWYRNYFYFCAKYNSPSPHSISPSFETKFARIEYTDNGSFALSYMRHTGQWWETYQQLSMSDCLKMITEEPHFMP